MEIESFFLSDGQRHLVEVLLSESGQILTWSLLSLSSLNLIRRNFLNLDWLGYLIEKKVNSSESKFYLVSTKCNFVCAVLSNSDSLTEFTDLE